MTKVTSFHCQNLENVPYELMDVAHSSCPTLTQNRHAKGDLKATACQWRTTAAAMTSLDSNEGHHRPLNYQSYLLNRKRPSL